VSDVDEDVENEDLPVTATLPLDSWHRARGGRMVEFAGYWLPVQYVGEGGGIIAEHLWTREHAGLFDVSHMGQLLLSGEGVPEALETLLPGDIVGLKPGRIRYSLLLSPEGGILDDLMVTNASSESGPEWFVVVNGATKWDDIGYLREHLPDEVTLNHMEERALLALQGPEAATALARLLPETAELSFMQSMSCEWHGHTFGVSRSGYTGEDGFEISLPGEAAEAFAEALCALAEVRPIGLGARDSLRLEAGLPLYGHDLDEHTDPVSAGLAFAINKRRRSEGGFAGAERILATLEQGPQTQRVGLSLEGRQAAREGAEIYDGATRTGHVSSGGFSPSLQRPIAMGWVASRHASAGTRLEIDVRGKRIPAVVVDLPFVPHRYHRKGAA
jgi:aminomethyltransferase